MILTPSMKTWTLSHLQKHRSLGETHEVVTEDGHILQMHRLVGSKRSPIASNKPPVLLVHGLMDCSATWVMGIPEVAQYDPAGAAVRQFVHYAQLINSGGFVQYDHGLLGNLRVYGQARPPKYNVANIKIPVYIFYSSKDQLVNEQDIRKLYMELPNAQKFMVPLKDFSHLDFVWGKDVDTLLYNRVLSRMEVHRGNI